MEIDMAFVADAATVDAAGKLNVLGVYDTIVSPQFPLKKPQMVLVIRFVAHGVESGSHPTKIWLMDADGQKLINADVEVNFQEGAGGEGRRLKGQILFSINSMVFPKPGDYSFEIIVDEKNMASVPLYLRQGAQGPPPMPPRKEPWMA